MGVAMKRIKRSIKRLPTAIRGRRTRLLVITGILFTGLAIATFVTPYKAPAVDTYFYSETETTPRAIYTKATVLTVSNDSMTVRILEGDRAGNEATLAWKSDSHRSTTIHQGSTVVVGEFGKDNDTLAFIDNFRIPSLIILTTSFIIIVIAVGGRRGAASLIGLGLSVLILGWFVVPFILAGHDAFWVCVAGSYMIALSSILIAHGFKRRTLISIICIVIVLAIVCLLSYLVILFTNLSGMSDEVSFYLSQGLGGIDMRGIVAGGIIIATLGVLDDIITAQVAVIDELKKAKPVMTMKELYASGSSVGGEHIASLVNTLALAYAGASLPLVLQLVHNSTGSSMLLFNGEYIATEIVRTLVASAGLVLAVPVSTLIAAYMYDRLIK